MLWPKLLLGIAVLLFGTIGVTAFFKKSQTKSPVSSLAAKPVEIEKNRELRVAAPIIKKTAEKTPLPLKQIVASTPKKSKEIVLESSYSNSTSPTPRATATPLPDANRIEELFVKDGSKLPIVETITYKSRVDWQKGRPAWLYDYARHYNTSRHFIARSLHGKSDYSKQEIAEGDRFNVFKTGKHFEFYLLADLSRCKMWFYYEDLDAKERVLLKTYNITVGRTDGSRTSGFLTPLGTYSLGNKVAIYTPGIKGFHHGTNVEMISIFGSRWIPFDKEIAGCSAPAKGLGIHGMPHVKNSKDEWKQDASSLGKYDSDGCIRMEREDLEELFAIVLTKPTKIQLVKDFYEATPVNK